jgi:hypothetical protein
MISIFINKLSVNNIFRRFLKYIRWIHVKMHILITGAIFFKMSDILALSTIQATFLHELVFLSTKALLCFLGMYPRLSCL